MYKPSILSEKLEELQSAIMRAKELAQTLHHTLREEAGRLYQETDKGIDDPELVRTATTLSSLHKVLPTEPIVSSLSGLYRYIQKRGEHCWDYALFMTPTELGPKSEVQLFPNPYDFEGLGAQYMSDLPSTGIDLPCYEGIDAPELNAVYEDENGNKVRVWDHEGLLYVSTEDLAWNCCSIELPGDAICVDDMERACTSVGGRKFMDNQMSLSFAVPYSGITDFMKSLPHDFSSPKVRRLIASVIEYKPTILVEGVPKVPNQKHYNRSTEDGVRVYLNEEGYIINVCPRSLLYNALGSVEAAGKYLGNLGVVYKDILDYDFRLPYPCIQVQDAEGVLEDMWVRWGDDADTVQRESYDKAMLVLLSWVDVDEEEEPLGDSGTDEVGSCGFGDAVDNPLDGDITNCDILSVLSEGSSEEELEELLEVVGTPPSRPHPQDGYGVSPSRSMYMLAYTIGKSLASHDVASLVDFHTILGDSGSEVIVGIESSFADLKNSRGSVFNWFLNDWGKWMTKGDFSYSSNPAHPRWRRQINTARAKLIKHGLMYSTTKSDSVPRANGLPSGFFYMSLESCKLFLELYRSREEEI